MLIQKAQSLNVLNTGKVITATSQQVRNMLEWRRVKPKGDWKKYECVKKKETYSGLLHGDI